MKPTQPCIVYLVRHGETHWNVKEIMQGHTDIDLTEKGVQQAIALSKELEHVYFDIVLSSDLIRAQRTAHLASLHPIDSIKTTPEMRERSFGAYEGKPAKEAWAILRTLLDTHHESHPHLEKTRVETNFSMRKRITNYLHQIATEYPGKCILFVSHGGVFKQLLIHLRYASATQFAKGAIENTAYLVLSISDSSIDVLKTKGIHLAEAV